MTDSLLRQAAMSALWALDINDRWHYANDEHGGYPESELCDQTQAAIATLRTALAQQAAQPVAFDHDQMARFAWTCSAPALDAGSIMDRLRAFREYEATRGRAIPAAQAQQAAPFTPGELVKMNEAWLHRRSMGLHDPEAIPVVQPVADICTDPYNCKRCKTHPNHRGDLPHAGIGWYPAAQPQQAADWMTPTTYLQRMSDAVTLLCCGKRPIDEMVAAWIAGSSEDLQSWCIERGPAWAQGIVVLDAAALLAETPTDGVEHEAAQPRQAPVQAAQPVPPIDMVLHCPKCGLRHVDEAEGEGDDEATTQRLDVWRNPPHRSHLCHGCGHIWRPADVPTNGVAAIKTHGTNDSAIAQPQQAAQPVAWRYEDARGHFRYRGYVPNFDVEYATLKPIPLFAAAQPQQKPGSPQ